MASSSSTSQAHVADIGRLLMSVQHELHELRGKVGTGAGGSDDLDAVLDRAESHLRAKAEVVLRAAASEHAVTLPAIPTPRGPGDPASHRGPSGADPYRGEDYADHGDYGNYGAGGDHAAGMAEPRRLAGSGPAPTYSGRGSLPFGASPVATGGRKVHPRFHARSRSAVGPGARHLRDHVHRKEVDPSRAAADRGALEQRFGVPRPAPPPPARAVGRRAPSGSAVRRERLAPPPHLLPAVNRNDPQAEPPRVTEGAVRRYGMYNLAKAGFIPPDVDLTEAMLEAGPAGGLLRSSAARLHPAEEALVKHEGMISLRNPTDNIKLDLATPVVHSGPSRHGARRAGGGGHPDGADPGDPDDAEARLNAELALFADAAGTFGAADGDGAGGEGEGAGEGGEEGGEEGGADGDGRDESGKATTGPVRSYDELMDEFSLHHFIIRHGKTITQTPEYESFRRRNDAMWGEVQSLIRQLETLLANYAVPFAYVDGPRVVELASDEVHRPTRDELLQCFLNADTVRPIFARPGQRYRGKNGRRAAATAIQARWRMWAARRRYRVEKVGVTAVVKIQSLWRMVTARRAAEVRIEAMRVEKARRWAELQADFRDAWGRRFDGRKRLIIHLNSLSFDVQQRRTMDNLQARQNGQMSRLCDIADPDVEVVYLSPYPLQDDLLQYYNKLLQIACEPGTNPSRRYKILHPENHKRFPSHFSLAQLVLYSPRCLKKLKSLIRGKAAYIQPGVVSSYEVELAVHLGIPLMGVSPEVGDLFSTKTGAKAIFEAADVATAPSVRSDLFDEESVLAGIASLVAANLEVPRWVLKIDDEFGGRGHAILDVDSLPCYPGLVEEKRSSAEIWTHPSVQDAVSRQVREDLVSGMADYAVLCQSRLYRSWEQYLSVFTRVGGLIEACPAVITGSPSVNLFIFPDGRVELLNAHDQFFGRPYEYAGALFPQSSAPFAALRDASLSVARELAAKGVLGHVGIDYITFPEDGRRRLWAVDLNLRPTDTVNAFRMFNFVMRGEFDQATGKYLVDVGAEEPQARTYVIADFLRQPNLATVAYNMFFGLCRQRGITFDLQDKVGTMYNILDNLSRGCLGILCVGRTYADSLADLVTAMSFIQNQLGENGQGGGAAPIAKGARAEGAGFRQVSNVVRAMLAQEREIQKNVGDQPHRIDQAASTHAGGVISAVRGGVAAGGAGDKDKGKGAQGKGAHGKGKGKGKGKNGAEKGAGGSGVGPHSSAGGISSAVKGSGTGNGVSA